MELKAVTDWLLGLKNGGQVFKIFVDLHSFGQLWLYPYSYANETVAVLPDLLDVVSVQVHSIESLPYILLKILDE